MIYFFVFFRIGFLFQKKTLPLQTMIELERHIEILLLRHDCVIVPDFGGFMTHHVEARYDEEEQLFLPPVRTIGFNPQLKMNDSLLVQSYIEVYDISYPEALRRIEEEVNEIRQRLSNEGSCEFRNIGTLYMSDEDIYTFEPCEAGILTPSLYGLGSFEMAPLDAKMHVVSENALLAEEKTHVEEKNTTTVGESKANSILMDDDDEEEDSKFIRVRVSVLRNLAAACIAIIVFFVASTPLGNTTTQVVKSSIDTGVLHKLMPKEVMERKVVSLPQQPSPSKVTPVNVTSQVDTVPETFFCIVMASKVTKRNASLYVEELQHKGYEKSEVLIGHGATKVIYGNYPNEREAYNALRSLNGKKEFADGWVLKVKGK